MSFSTRASCKRRKNSSAVFPAKPMVHRRISIQLKILDGFRSSTESELLSLEAKRILESHVAFGNKEGTAVKSGEIVQFEQAILGGMLRFHVAAATDV